MAGDEIAGFILSFVDPAHTERTGRNEGVLAEVGVRRPWRKRGLASALISHSLKALRAVGMDSAILGVDTENPSGAVSIYERLGFRELRKNVILQ